MARPVGTSNKPKDEPLDHAPKLTRTRKKKATRAMTDALVGIIALPPQFLYQGQFALSEDERKALSIALYDAAASNDLINNIIVNLTGTSGIGELVLVSGAIVGKRVLATRFDLTHPDPLMMLVLAGSDTVIKAVASKGEEDNEQTETRPTHPTSGQYGKRENNTGAENPTDANLQRRTPDESGYSFMGPSVEDYPEGEAIKNNGGGKRLVRSKAKDASGESAD